MPLAEPPAKIDVMSQVLAVGLLGVFSRWAIDLVAGRWFEIFPVGILVINIVGSVIAGVVYVMGTEKALMSPHISVGLLVGFCGGFTTFSAYSIQVALYLERADLIRGIGYLCASPVLGVLGVFLGIFVARVWA